MNCKDAMEKISSHNRSFPKELEDHILSCKTCRELAETWKTLKDIPIQEERTEPHSALDFIVRREAAAFLERRRSFRKIFFRWTVLSTAAACFALAVWLGLPAFNHKDKSPATDNVEAASMIQEKTTIPWNNVDMDDDFFEIGAELELNFAALYFNDNAQEEKEESDETFDVEIPDLLT